LCWLEQGWEVYVEFTALWEVRRIERRSWVSVGYGYAVREIEEERDIEETRCDAGERVKVALIKAGVGWLGEK